MNKVLDTCSTLYDIRLIANTLILRSLQDKINLSVSDLHFMCYLANSMCLINLNHTIFRNNFRVKENLIYDKKLYLYLLYSGQINTINSLLEFNITKIKELHLSIINKAYTKYINNKQYHLDLEYLNTKSPYSYAYRTIYKSIYKNYIISYYKNILKI